MATVRKVIEVPDPFKGNTPTSTPDLDDEWTDDDEARWLEDIAKKEATQSQSQAESPTGKPKAQDRTQAKAAEAFKAKAAPQTMPRRRGVFVGPLTELYGAAGMGVSLVDPTCGSVILESAEGCAKSLDELAYTNESVRRVLTKMTQGSAIGSVLVAHVPIMLVVASHHGPGNKKQKHTESDS